MNKQDIISFFDRLAPQWDADMIRHEDVITKILEMLSNPAVMAGIADMSNSNYIIKEEKIKELEEEIDNIEGILPKSKEFVLYGKCERR